MNAQRVTIQSVARHKMIPMVLSIAGNLLLWTLGFTTMSLARTEDKQQRLVREFQIDHARVENLQRWVNSGHDTWCRSGELVAQATLRRIAPEFAGAELELASLPPESKKLGVDKVIYTYHLLDGRTTYRITVVRLPWLIHSAGSKSAIVWVPVRSEQTTQESNTQERND
jgi:hypothetical protein